MTAEPTNQIIEYIRTSPLIASQVAGMLERMSEGRNKSGKAVGKMLADHPEIIDALLESNPNTASSIAVILSDALSDHQKVKYNDATPIRLANASTYLEEHPELAVRLIEMNPGSAKLVTDVIPKAMLEANNYELAFKLTTTAPLSFRGVFYTIYSDKDGKSFLESDRFLNTLTPEAAKSVIGALQPQFMEDLPKLTHQLQILLPDQSALDESCRFNDDLLIPNATIEQAIDTVLGAPTPELQNPELQRRAANSPRKAF